MTLSRRKARQDALQILYQIDMQGERDARDSIESFRKNFLSESGKMDPFVERLVLGVIRHCQDIDRHLMMAQSHWRIDRMGVIDRNILRMGVFELAYCDDIPATVTLNEMVELAKLYGDAETSSFVNGVLDELKDKLVGPNKAP